MLDYFPNADHAGLYAAQAAGDYARAGLDVEIKPPPDPSAPLKLLQSGRADLVISYEPELLLARDKGAELVSVGALVQKPLTTLMSLKDITRPEDLAGKRVGTAGLPYQSAYLKTILAKAGVDPETVKETSVGFNLVPAMLSDKVDATLGAFWNYEGEDLKRRGRHPKILRMEKLGVPTYDELIFVVRRKDLDEELLLEAAALPARHRARPRAPAGEPGDRRRRAAEGRSRVSSAGCRPRSSAPRCRSSSRRTGRSRSAGRSRASGTPTGAGCSRASCSSGSRTRQRR